MSTRRWNVVYVGGGILSLALLFTGIWAQWRSTPAVPTSEVRKVWAASESRDAAFAREQKQMSREVTELWRFVEELKRRSAEREKQIRALKKQADQKK